MRSTSVRGLALNRVASAVVAPDAVLTFGNVSTEASQVIARIGPATAAGTYAIGCTVLPPQGRVNRDVRGSCRCSPMRAMRRAAICQRCCRASGRASARVTCSTGLHCREYLASSGDIIEDFSIATASDDLQAPLVVNIGGDLVAWLAGGTAGTAYTATWTIKLASGQIIVVPIGITVSAAPSMPAPPLPAIAVRASEATPLLTRDGPALLPANGALTRAATTTDGAASRSSAAPSCCFDN